jgi:sn-glycerol 3-phosphate transport system substrate-binding protein
VKKNKLFVLSIVLLVLALALTACPGGAPEPAAPAPAEPAPAAPEPAAEEPAPEPAAEEPAPEPAAEAPAETVEVEFWTLLTGSLGARLDEQVQQFNQSQDEVRVVNIFQGDYEELNQKLLASVAAGNPPPITMVDYILVPFYAQQGVFLSLSEVATEEEMAGYYQELLGDLSYQGEVYALPYNRSTQGLYYNKDMFEEVGLDPDSPPDTWEEFAEYSRIITESGERRSGSFANFTRWFFEPFIYQWGAEMNDDECNPTFQETGGVEVLEFFQNLYHDEGVVMLPSNLAGGFDQQALEFITGQVGMIRQSTAIQGFIGDAVDFDWGFAMLPAGPAGRAVTHGGGNVAITTNATPEQREAAWTFLSWLTAPEQSAEYHMATGYMPSSPEVLEMPEVQAFHEEYPSWLVSVDQLEFARPTSCVVVNTGAIYHNVMTEAIERVIINNEDPQAVLDRAAEELQFEIDRRRDAGELIEVP